MSDSKKNRSRANSSLLGWISKKKEGFLFFFFLKKIKFKAHEKINIK